MVSFFSQNITFSEQSGGGSMAIKLFEHNQQAYKSVVAMLAETGKAAVIHPTGTGKSFIHGRCDMTCW